MASAIDTRKKENLLTAAMSAILGVHLELSTDALESAGTFSLFNHHNKTYSYGPVGGIPSSSQSSNDLVEIHVRALTGKDVICRIDAETTVEDLKMQMQAKEGIPPDQQRLIFAGRQLEDGAKLIDYGIHNDSVVHIVLRLRGGGPAVLDPSSMDPHYDYDFTNVKDANKVFTRGGVAYGRPCGWKRLAIRVSDKYEDLTWLGKTNSSGEWPVSYHGTGLHQSKTIAMDGYDLTKGKRFAYGHGIYSTPDINVAEKYAVQFLHEGEPHLVVLQNRVNPTSLIRISADRTRVGDYWISPNDKDVRPYGLCIRKVKK